jgi:3-(3-hydroxy-phenyl)propionate hydroxylase
MRVAQDDTSAGVTLADGQVLPVDEIFGCDGGRSVVRKAAAVEFPAGIRRIAT